MTYNYKNDRQWTLQIIKMSLTSFRCLIKLWNQEIILHGGWRPDCNIDF